MMIIFHRSLSIRSEVEMTKDLGLIKIELCVNELTRNLPTFMVRFNQIASREK